MVFTSLKVWSGILRKSNKDLLYCEFSAVKKTMFQTYLRKYENSD